MSRKKEAAHALARERCAQRPKPLQQQVRAALKQQCAFGTSKQEDKKAGVDTYTKIYSYKTYENYLREGRLFVNWCEEKHGCKTLEECKQHREGYIQSQIDKGYSAHTIKKRAASVGKLYGDHFMKNIKTPERHRSEITKSRGVASRDAGFSTKKNEKLIRFCQATGLRRHELKPLKPSQLVERDGEMYLRDVKGKGGKVRDVPVIKDREIVREMMSGKADKNVFEKAVPSHADIHSFRADYACDYYRRVARPIEEVPREERYYCRADMAGRVFDKQAMLEVSQALGHNRIDVIASNYLYNL